MNKVQIVSVQTAKIHASYPHMLAEQCMMPSSLACLEFPDFKYGSLQFNNQVLRGLDTITKTCLFKYTENFNTKKWKFSGKKYSYFFHISDQNRDCGYSLEPPRRGGLLYRYVFVMHLKHAKCNVA